MNEVAVHGENEFHAESPNGILLTRYYPGGHKPAYEPLTHLMVAAKAPGGVVLIATDNGALWTLPGGAVEPGLDYPGHALTRLNCDTGLKAEGAAVLGYYRIVSNARVEYGALVFCAVSAVPKTTSGPSAFQWRTWDGMDCLCGLDPISETLAMIAMDSVPWQDGD